jgi:hypothetical protein
VVPVVVAAVGVLGIGAAQGQLRIVDESGDNYLSGNPSRSTASGSADPG